MSGRNPLVVGVDYLPAVCHAPGIGRHARELVRALVRLQDPSLALRLFELGGGSRTVGEAALGLAGYPVQRLRGRFPRRAQGWLARLSGVDAARLLGGVDVFHRNRLQDPPLRRTPQVLPVLELPLLGSAGDAALARAIARSSAVVVASQHYARTVAERYDLSPDRVHHVGVGCEHWSRELPDASQAAGRPQAPGRPRMIVMGAVRAARHPLVVLSALERLRAGGVDAELVWVGRPADAAAELTAALERSPAREAFRWVRDPVERDQGSLVASATLLLHVAADEGSAVTPLEAFSLGTAVVASRLPAFEEALGGQATLLDGPALTGGSAQLSDALAKVLLEPGDPERARSRRRIAAEHSWRSSAVKTLKVWQHVHALGSGVP